MNRKFIILVALWLFGAGMTSIYAIENTGNACYDQSGLSIPCEKGTNGCLVMINGYYEEDYDCDGFGISQDECPNLWGPETNSSNSGCPDGVIPGECTNCYNDSGVPVGSGLLLLLGGAAAYGFSLFRRRKNDKV